MSNHHKFPTLRIKFRMCGIAGFINYHYPKTTAKQIITRMNATLRARGEDDSGYLIKRHAVLGHQRLSIIDVANGHQPMAFTYHGETYTIVYNGEIYNTAELRTRLTTARIKLQTTCDTELLLKCFALDGEKCLDYVNGIFAFAIYAQKSQRLFLARDPLGVKPLFYAEWDGRLVFASEIKALFQHPEIKPRVNRDGLRQLFGIAPARLPGQTVYAGIAEIKPGACAWFVNGQLRTRTYWQLTSRPHPDDAATTAARLQEYLTKIVARQLVSDVPAGLFLSGGLDSSVVTAAAARTGKVLQTFSVDYVGNAENFVPTDFTPSRDNQFIDLVAAQYHAQHHYELLNSPDLFQTLHEALLARDYPAMADIDSSLLLFCRAVKSQITVCLSGEFADEIFCGYPWFYRADTRHANTFPWAIDLTIREQTINKALRADLDIANYVAQAYAAAVAEVPLSPADTDAERQMKIYSYLTMRYFGLNLLERTDRMAMRSGLEVRVPFTDPDLVQYVYNIPWQMKNYGGYEKGILRLAFADQLPSKVVYRKKSPYPKTVDPAYNALVEQRISALLVDETNPLWTIVDLDYVTKVLHDHTGNQTRPWFGQLMNRTQYLAFIVQIEMWLREYQIILDL